jgi:hypothetical protein
MQNRKRTLTFQAKAVSLLSFSLIGGRISQQAIAQLIGVRARSEVPTILTQLGVNWDESTVPFPCHDLSNLSLFVFN